MWKRIIGKEVKIIFKLRYGVSSVYGTVIDANNSFVVTKDQYGKIHFLNVKGIVRVSERWNSQGEIRKQENQIVEPLNKGENYRGRNAENYG